VDGFDLGPWLDLLRSGLWVTVYATVLGTLLATVVAFALGLLSLTPECTEGNDYCADLFHDDQEVSCTHIGSSPCARH
jgi:ABC-type amino acid transport system permease subunit